MSCGSLSHADNMGIFFMHLLFRGLLDYILRFKNRVYYSPANTPILDVSEKLFAPYYPSPIPHKKQTFPVTWDC